MLLHVLPQDFTLDGRAGYRKPHKGVCSRLEANVHLVTASVQEHQALIAAAHLAHLAVEETVFEPMAAAYACVRPGGARARRRGGRHRPAVDRPGGLRRRRADAGLQHSGVGRSFHARHRLRCSRSPTRTPRCLKQEYGCALLGLTADSTLIEVPSPEGRPLAGSAPQRAERGSGSPRRGIVRLRARRDAARRHGAESARRRRADRRRRAAARHVRYGGESARIARPATGWRRGHRRLAGGVEEPGVDHRRRPGDVFGEVEAAPSAAAAASAA